MIVDTDPLKNIPGLDFFLSVDKVELIPAGADFACYCSFQREQSFSGRKTTT
jgi:hypothetical protein